MTQNLQFLHDQIELSAGKSQYWRQVQILLAQFNGMVDGYQKYCTAEERLESLDLYFLQAAGDMENLIGALAGVNNVKPEAPFMDCSALVKVTHDNLYAGHTTWRSYGLINKFHKRYNTNFKNAKSNRVAFASSPSFLSSKDDYYVTDQNLVVMETTNSVFNGSLYTNYITPKSVLTWMRSIIANSLATNGKEWTDTFAKYNSGTYDNQWMVVDYKLFTAGQPIKPNTLWILEQIPGFVEAGDVSQVLAKQGYWPSYNIPFFERIYNLSGYPEQMQKVSDPDNLTYNKCFRAKIFAVQQAKIQSLKDFQYVMQYNEWQTDPLSQGDPGKAIASRYDLRTANVRIAVC